MSTSNSCTILEFDGTQRKMFSSGKHSNATDTHVDLQHLKEFANKLNYSELSISYFPFIGSNCHSKTWLDEIFRV